MIETDDIQVRRFLGVTVANLSINQREVLLTEPLITGQTFDPFLLSVEQQEKIKQRKLNSEELVIAWKEWWTSQIPKYTQKPIPIGPC